MKRNTSIGSPGAEKRSSLLVWIVSDEEKMLINIVFDELTLQGNSEA